MLQSLYSLAATGSFCWFLASSLWIYPHSLSYFNESVGGPLNGPKHLLGSNVDWGQDLRYLESWRTARSDLLPVHLAFFSSINPSDVGFRNTLPWPERLLIFSQEMNFNGLKDWNPGKGWYFISENLFLGQNDQIRGGRARRIQSSIDRRLLHFIRLLPVYGRAGYSCLIYIN